MMFIHITVTDPADPGQVNVMDEDHIAIRRSL